MGTESYVTLLIESLQRKDKILDEIIIKNQQQSELLGEKDVSFDALDQTILEKEELIQQLSHLDEGFQSVYDRVRVELRANEKKYGKQIAIMQQLIQTITDKGVSIQTMEKRNKKRIEDYFQYTRKEMRQTRRSTTAANNYYKSMNHSNLGYTNSIDEKK